VKYGQRIHDMTEERARAQGWQDLADRWSRPEHQDEVALANLPPGDEDEGIAVVEIIEDMVANRNGLHVVNTVNHGAISNLPPEAVVEVLALVGSYGVRPVYTGALPEPIAAALRHHISTQQLTVEAALTGDRRAALHAFLLDPVVSAALEPDPARQLLDDLLRAHAAYLPQFS
jgi:alpha-galactosidase/6-phospho-beta-glucosidase family protein